MCDKVIMLKMGNFDMEESTEIRVIIADKNPVVLNLRYR